jgi:alpha-beta hydrolase superfamily lysophospholipase
MSERVVLVHGLWMRSLAMAALGRRLRAAGFEVELFDYPSVFGGPGLATERLRRRFESRPDETIHAVGHSLGAIVLLDALRDVGPKPAGRVVCLGAPLKGSVAAQRAGRWPGTAFLVGRHGHKLAHGVAPWTGPRDVGVVAGRLPMGVGTLLHAMPRPHDGTVAVSETELEGIRDHRVVAATHTGLLFSDEVAALTTRFLREGSFGEARP